jgi:DNA-binding XRE family transcriptional regulator
MLEANFSQANFSPYDPNMLLAIDIGSRFSIHTSSFFISSIGYYSRTKYMGYLNIALERDWSCSL